jgi:hypothetical protein
MEDITSLQEWQRSRSESHIRFVDAQVADPELKHSWQQELPKYEEVVHELALEFLGEQKDLAAFMDAGWGVARKKIATGSPVIPSGEESIERWCLDLFEQLRLYHEILVEDIHGWSAACKRFWAA